MFVRGSVAPISKDRWSCFFIVRERGELFEWNGETAYAVNQNVTCFYRFLLWKFVCEFLMCTHCVGFPEVRPDHLLLLVFSMCTLRTFWDVETLFCPDWAFLWAGLHDEHFYFCFYFTDRQYSYQFLLYTPALF